MPVIHHVSIGSNDLARSRAFYDPVLEALGVRLRKQDEEGVHYGGDIICFSLVLPVNGSPAAAGNGVHIAFTAKDRAAVDAFYQTAMRAGGRDAGPPGLRPQYSPDYYGAFVLDPDGNKIEAVHEPTD